MSGFGVRVLGAGMVRIARRAAGRCQPKRGTSAATRCQEGHTLCDERQSQVCLRTERNIDRVRSMRSQVEINQEINCPLGLGRVSGWRQGEQSMLDRTRAFREDNTRKIDSKDEFYDFFTPSSAEKPEIHGGFALCHWSGDAEEEEKVKADLNVTIRCIPLDAPEEDGKCVISGKPSSKRVIFAKAY